MSPAQTSMYWRLWRDVCKAQGWDQADREQRMSVHRQCLGRERSMKLLTNKELDRVYAQFRLLIDPEDIDSQVALECPEAGQLGRVVYALGLCPDDLVRQLCRDKFDRANWRALPLVEATQLLMTVKRVLRHHPPQALHPAHAAPDDDSNNPF